MDPAQLAHSGSPLPSFPHDVTPVSQTPTKADVDEVMALPTQSPGTFTNEQIVANGDGVDKDQAETDPTKGQTPPKRKKKQSIANENVDKDQDKTDPSPPKRERKQSKLSTFCKEFLCKYLPEHGRDLVTLTEENEHFVLKLNSVDKISSCYYGFKESTTGKILGKDPKRRNEIITKSMRDLEKKGFLKKFGDGREYGIPFLKYEVQDDELLDLLKSNYTVQRNAAMIPDSSVVTNVTSDNDPPFITRESPDSWKWEMESKIHREKFEKLLEKGRQQPEAVKVITGVRVCCSADFLIGRGGEGTRVYVGLGTDGKEKAVKRLPKDACDVLAEQEKKVLNRAKSQYVVNYWILDKESDPENSFLILDLCEETLKSFVEKKSLEFLIGIAPDITRQILKGLKDLHGGEIPILHRDLKPSNILRNVDDKWLLADFGISRFLPAGKSTLRSDERGTTYWRAVESYDSDDGKVRYKKESDIQVAGMVVFYIVTKGQHAFGQEEDRLRNLRDGNPVGVERLKDPSLKDLLSWMLSHDPGERPSAEEALQHPYLQSKKNQFEMLCKVGNQPEIKKRSDGTSDGTSDVVSQLNNDPINWESKLRTKIFNHFTMQRKIKYNTNEWKDCLRLMRNVNQHWFDDRTKTDPEVLNDVGTLHEYFLTLFPDFPVKVHRIIRSCDWKEREELKEYFK